MAFIDDIPFPFTIKYGSSGTISFLTDVLELKSGHEQRNKRWSQFRAKFIMDQVIHNEAQFEVLKNFFIIAEGRANGFRVHDPLNFKLVRQVIGVTDGSTAIYQLINTYTSGVNTYARDIHKVVADVDVENLILKAWVNSVAQTVVAGAPAAGEVQVNRNTGVITLGSTHAATSGDDIEIECEYHTPVRFEIDELVAQYEDFEAFAWNGIGLIQTRDIV